MKLSCFFKYKLAILICATFTYHNSYGYNNSASECVRDTRKQSSLGKSALQKKRAEQLVSLFENDTINPDYGYAEVLHDGRGITAGKVGFTTGTGDAYLVLKKYSELKPQNEMIKYLPVLLQLETARDKDSLKGLDGFIKAWKKAAKKDSLFIQAQDLIADQLYYNPALSYANDVGLTTALGKAIIFDTIVQHGDDNSVSDPDSLLSIIEKTNELSDAFLITEFSEKQWLRIFLGVRRSVLKNPYNKSTQKVWSESTDRIDVLSTLLENNNLELNGPIRIHTKSFRAIIP